MALKKFGNFNWIEMDSKDQKQNESLSISIHFHFAGIREHSELRPASDNERCCQYNTDSFAPRSHRSSACGRARTARSLCSPLFDSPQTRVPNLEIPSSSCCSLLSRHRSSVVDVRRWCERVLWRPLQDNAPREVLVSGYLFGVSENRVLLAHSEYMSLVENRLPI